MTSLNRVYTCTYLVVARLSAVPVRVVLLLLRSTVAVRLTLLVPIAVLVGVRGLLLAVLWGGRGVGPLRGCVGRAPGAAPSPAPLLLGRVDGSLEVGEEAGVHVLRGRHHVGRNVGRDGSRNRLPVVRLEPLDEFVHAAVNLVPVPESVWSHAEVLQKGLVVRLVTEDELARELLRGAKEVRDSFRVLCLFY